MNKDNLKITVVVAVFLLLAIEVLVIRGYRGIGGIPYADGLSPLLSSPFSNIFGDAYLPRARLVPYLGYYLFGNLALLIDTLLPFDIENSPLFRGSPWAMQARTTFMANHVAVPLVSYLAFGLLTLAPMLWITLSWWRRTVPRVLVIALMLWAIIGWHPTIITLYFEAASQFFDWPRSYYLYSDDLKLTDFCTIAVLYLVALYLARPKQAKGWELAAFAILAQLTVEHLGVLFIVAVTVHAFLTERPDDNLRTRLIAAFRTFRWAFLGAVLAAMVAAALYFSSGHELALGLDRGPSKAAFIQQNFDNFRSIIANVITVAGLAFLAGLLVGIVCAVSNRRNGGLPESRYTQLSVLVSLIFGYLVTLCLGFFTIMYPSEMGRQLTPLATLCVITGVVITEIVVAKVTKWCRAA